MAFGLLPEAAEGPGLLEPPSFLGQRASLMAAVDKINRQYGRETVKLTARGGAKAPWRARWGRLSPISTTDWDSLPVVKA
jgi:DNA polymerase V